MGNDEKQKVIWDLQEVILQIYREKGIRSLSGLERDFMVNGRQIFAWFFDVVRNGQLKFKSTNFHKLFDDLIFCSDEIAYFTAHLYLYGPYMNNPLDDSYRLGDKVVYPNIQNLEAKRFSMYANVVSEKVYDYWDRLGDLIAAYFPDRIDLKRVFFPTAVAIVPQKYHQSDNYKWLLDFKNGEYKAVNNKRKEIVHYLTSDTDFKHKHLHSSTDEDALFLLIAERYELPQFYTAHITATLDGFERVVSLINEVSEEALSGDDGRKF